MIIYFKEENLEENIFAQATRWDGEHLGCIKYWMGDPVLYLPSGKGLIAYFLKGNSPK